MENKVKEMRWKKGWSQRELARKAGVGRSTISALEAGENKNPSVEVAYKLHKVFDVDVWELFYFE